MKKLDRREFILTASAATFAIAAGSRLAAATPDAEMRRKRRVFVGSSAPDGILSYDWDPTKGELTAVGVAAKVPRVAWLAFSHEHKFVYSASELPMFNGKPTGEVASFRIENGELHPLTAENSAGVGTCHVGIDHTGQMLIAADYVGGSASSFTINEGRLSKAVWTEHYTFHGPNTDRHQTAHAHFASFSPDNRFAYINDLGGDCIHIYRPEITTAAMTPAGTYKGVPGSGPRTLHFHPNGHTAYCMNELASTVDVLEWHKADGSLTLTKRIHLFPEGYSGPTSGCDTVISQDGRFVYFANRGNNSIYTFKADVESGGLTLVGHSDCGGKTPRNFVLDPSEKWMLVANEDSNLITVFARNPETGIIAEEGKSVAAQTPMRILFM